MRAPSRNCSLSCPCPVALPRYERSSGRRCASDTSWPEQQRNMSRQERAPESWSPPGQQCETVIHRPSRRRYGGAVRVAVSARDVIAAGRGRCPSSVLRRLSHAESAVRNPRGVRGTRRKHAKCYSELVCFDRSQLRSTIGTMVDRSRPDDPASYRCGRNGRELAGNELTN